MAYNIVTQEYSSENDYSLDSDEFFTQQNQGWGYLHEMATRTRKIIELQEEKKFGFGRLKGSADNDNFMEANENEFIRHKSYALLSRQHFYIEKLHTERPLKLVPGVLEVVGRNGLYINGTKLSVGDRRLLRDGDLIKIHPDSPLFRFQYKTRNELSDCEGMEDYFVGDVVGSGANGSVYSIWKVIEEGEFGFKNYAAKKLDKRGPCPREQEQYEEKLFKEVEIMKKMQNLNVLKLFEYYSGSDHLVIILPMMNGGDLLQRITTSPRKRLDERDAKFFLLQLFLGLRYMHENSIAHRDIKCENLLLSDNGLSPLLKISDFGLSKVIQETKNTICGTLNYVAPEILKNDMYYTHKVDVWSSGVVLYTMLSGCFPFHGEKIRESIQKGKFNFPYTTFQNVSEDAKTFINKMLIVNPKHRMEVPVLLQQSWLRDFELNARLEEVFEKFNDEDFGVNDNTLTEDIERTLENVTINEFIQPAKRPRRE